MGVFIFETAYKKALLSLTSDIMSTSAEDDMKFAQELLPRSQRRQSVLAGGNVAEADASGQTTTLDSGMDVADDRENNPLDGVKFARLTAPGPSGF